MIQEEPELEPNLEPKSESCQELDEELGLKRFGTRTRKSIRTQEPEPILEMTEQE